MNEVITKLYEIEETAGQILRDARRYKEQLQQQMAMEQRAYEKEIEADLKHRLLHAREQMDEQAQKEITSQQIAYQKQIADLDAAYDGHLDELAEKIFCKIIEV